MNGFYNTVREQAISSGDPDEMELLIMIQWRPPKLDDPDGNIPPREYLATIAELKALPVVQEPPPPVVHDPNALKVILTASKNVRQKPVSTSKLIREMNKGDTVWVIGAKQNNYMLLEDKSGWIYVGGLAIADPSPTPPPVIPVPPSPQRIRGWGQHLMSGGEVRAGYPIYKSVDDPGLLAYARKVSPNATFIYRRWYPDNVQTERLHEMATAGVEVAFNRWFAENKGNLEAMPWAYHESYNEVDAPDAYIAFEKYRIEQLAKKGYKACVINIAAAHSDKAMWERVARSGLFDAAEKHGALIGEHSYAQTIMSANVGGSYWRQDGQWSGGELFPATVDPAQCLTGLRILSSKLIVANMGYAGLNWVATEMGWDDMSPGVYQPFGIHTSGFRSSRPIWERMGWLAGTTDVDFAIRQLNWWAEKTGCAGVVYTIGTGGDATWEDDNLSGKL